MAQRFGSSKDKAYSSRNRALSSLLRSSENVVATDKGLDSAEVLAIVPEAGIDSAAVTNLSNSLVDSDYIHGKGFIRSTAERRFDIKSATPFIHSHYSVGDFWLDRDDLILYKLDIDNNWTTTFPAATASAFSGLTFFNFIGHNYAPSNYTASITNGPNGVFSSTIATGGTTGNNTGCLITFSSPTNFSYFHIYNTVAGWVYRVNYEDGSYAVSNNNPSTRPGTITWYSSAGVALGKSFNVPNSGAQLQDWVHPQGKLTTSLVIGRGTYGTQNYNAWLFFAGQNTFQRQAQIFDPLSISSNLVPSTDSTYNLGDSDKQWKDLFLSGNTITLGGSTISLTNDGGISVKDSQGNSAPITGSNIFDSGDVTSIVDSSYVQARQSGGAITVQDEGSSLATSATTLNFVGSGVTASGTGATKTITISGGGGGGSSTVDSATVLSIVNAQSQQTTFTYTTASPTTTISGNDDNGTALSYTAGNIIVFQNGILLVDSVDYTATGGSSITLGVATDSGDIISVTKFTASSDIGHSQFKFVSATPQTTFSGTATHGGKLTYDVGNIQVFLNGILLVDSQDYTAADGSSIVLTQATDSNDVLAISKFSGGTREVFRSTQFVYTTASPTTTITGTDDNSAALSYIADQVQVFRNGILLIDSADYTATNGTSIVLGAATDSGDTVVITAFRGALSSGLDSADVLAIAGGAGGTDSATVISLSGELKGNMFRINPQSLSINTTIDSNENAHCAGPISFDSGVTLTINGNLVIS